MSILAAAIVPHPPIILPEIGHGEERKIQKTIDAYREVMRRAAKLRPETVILISPHAELYADYFHITPGIQGSGDFSNFRAPEVKISVLYDRELADCLSGIASKEDFPAGFLGSRQNSLTPDHGSMVPLYFLQKAVNSESEMPRVLKLSFSGLSNEMHVRYGEMIAEAVESLGRRAVFIASGDLSHKLKDDGPYGFHEAGPVFDEKTCEALQKGDFLSLLMMNPDLCENAAECGLRSFWTMIGALNHHQVRSDFLSHEGPFGVGYGVAYLTVGAQDDSIDILSELKSVKRKKMEEIRQGEDDFLLLARRSLETFIKTRTMLPMPQDLPRALLERRAGAFVSIKKDGNLRGCIGTFLPTQKTLAEEIIVNAVSAGTRDPRFPEVAADELESLVYDVDVLSAPEPVDDPATLDAKRYGVIVQADERRGLLLPDLAGVETPAQQIRIARQKANIGPKEPINLYRFEVERHG